MANLSDNENVLEVDKTSVNESTQAGTRNKSNAQKMSLSMMSLADMDGNAVEIPINENNNKGKLCVFEYQQKFKYLFIDFLFQEYNCQFS